MLAELYGYSVLADKYQYKWCHEPRRCDGDRYGVFENEGLRMGKKQKDSRNCIKRSFVIFARHRDRILSWAECLARMVDTGNTYQILVRFRTIEV